MTIDRDRQTETGDLFNDVVNCYDYKQRTASMEHEWNIWSVRWMTLIWDDILWNCHSATLSANPIHTRPGLKSGLRGHTSAAKSTDHVVAFPISVSLQNMCECYPLHKNQQLFSIPSHINPVNTLPEFWFSTLPSNLSSDLARSILISKFPTKRLYVSHVYDNTAN